MGSDIKDIKKLAPIHTLFFNKKMKDFYLKLQKRIVKKKIMIVINKLKLYHIKHIYIIQNFVCLHIILSHKYCTCISGILNEKDCID